MKEKKTKHQLKSNYYCVGVGANTIYNLLSLTAIDSYCSRCEGWACDNYIIYNKKYDLFVCLSCGYDPIKTDRITPKKQTQLYKICDIYERQANKIINKQYKKYETTKRKLNILIEQFTSELIQLFKYNER